jgi:hypothetical protein
LNTLPGNLFAFELETVTCIRHHVALIIINLLLVQDTCEKQE